MLDFFDLSQFFNLLLHRFLSLNDTFQLRLRLCQEFDLLGLALGSDLTCNKLKYLLSTLVLLQDSQYIKLSDSLVVIVFPRLLLHSPLEVALISEIVVDCP